MRKASVNLGRSQYSNPYVIDAFELKSGERIYLKDLEDHGLSYVPCDYDSPAVERFAHLWNKREPVTLASYGETDTDHYVFKQMRGVQIMTGRPTFLPSDTSPSGHLYLMDFDIENRLKTRYPDHYQRLIDTIYDFHGNRTPCHIKTKSDGARFSIYATGVIPKVWYKDFSEREVGDMLFEFFSKNGLSRLDDRYALVSGSLFEIPQFHSPEEVNALTEAVCDILEEIGSLRRAKTSGDAKVVERSQLGDLDIEWRETTITPEEGDPYTALVSQLFPTEVCHETSHASNRKEVSFTKFENGGVLGHCFNCGENWWEVPPPKRGVLKSLTPEEEQASLDRRIADAPSPGGPPPPKAKLQQVSSPTQTSLQTLYENREDREAAAANFLSTAVDSLHIQLVKDATGTGKTRTYIAVSKQQGKRTLGFFPHTDLAAQAVDIAHSLGYQNALRLLARDHNWDASGIEKIPVVSRGEALFELNNCLRVDEVQKYIDRRLAPRNYCEHVCPFLKRDKETAKILEICPHLAQYQNLEDRDFIATSAPNIFFQLTLRGYLKSIVTAVGEPPTAEELAIDANLGTESEQVDAITFGIVDDYTLNALFSDVTFKASEFEVLKRLWRGTPTAKFCKGVLKALKKTKPEKITKALRRTFERTAAHHKEIAENLTQHVRLGTIEVADSVKVSKETEKLLSEKRVRFAEGGKPLYVPVDAEAYRELKEKDVSFSVIDPASLDTQEIGDTVRLTYSPIQALMAEVSLEALTPVWERGVTPIETLGIFLEFIGNDVNAPIAKKFLTGDPPPAVITFSIPPQAPMGVLPQLVMLSATTDPEDIQQVFAGQPVTFSEHTGGELPFADGVQVYQFDGGRMTSGSVFAYQSKNGKRLLQEKPLGLSASAAKRLEKLNAWATAVDGVTAFISYKEFTEDFREAVSGFDIVTHFDKVVGLNFADLKFLVVFGYPKVKHEVVMEQARKQYASDCEPLPKGSYPELTETVEVTENGLLIQETRYRHPRLEKIRQQLSIEKLEQAIGRGRFFTWEDVTSILFTSAPLSITGRAVLFSQDAFRVATAPADIVAATERIRAAEASGDVKAVMVAKGVSQRTAYRSDAVKAKREAESDARDAEILRLAAAGKNRQQILQSMKSDGWKKVYPKIISEVVFGVTKIDKA